jgi:hypothetical protein
VGGPISTLFLLEEEAIQMAIQDTELFELS